MSKNLDLKVVIKVDGKRYEATLDRIEGKQKRLAESGKKTAAEVSQLGSMFKRAGLGLGVLTAAAGATIPALVRVNATAERMRATLASLEGSAVGGELALAEIERIASTTAYQIDDLTQAYIGLKSYGMDPLDGSMQILIDQTAALGGNQETLAGIVRGVGQAWTKQKLQGEEILQLLERGVPVWEMLERATGKSAAELEKLASAGKLGRREIRLLLEEMRKNSMGAAAREAQGLAGSISNLEDAVTRAARAFGEGSGFNAAVADAARWMTELIDSAIGAPRAVRAIEAEIKRLEETLDQIPARSRAARKARIGRLREELFAALGVSGDRGELERALTEVDRRIMAAARRASQAAERDGTAEYRGRGRNRRITEYGAANKELRRLTEQRSAIYERMAAIEARAAKAGTGEGEDRAAIMARDQARRALQDLNADLERQVQLFGRSQAAQIEYSVTSGELAQSVRLLGEEGEQYAASIVRQARALEEKERAAQEAEEAEQRRRELMAEGIALTEQVRTDYERLEDEITRYRELLDAGAISQETFNRAVFAAGEAFGAAGDGAEVAAEKLSMMDELARSAARGMQSAFADFLFDPFEDGVEGMLEAFGQMLRRMLAELLAKKILMDLFTAASGGNSGGFWGQLAAGVMHTGGRVGSGSGVQRSVSPLLFVGAPRYHDGGTIGLKPGEVPIIAQTGETVIPRGGITVPPPKIEIINNTGAPVQTEQVQADGRQITRVTIGEAAADVIRGGELSRAIASTFGLRRATAGVS